MTCNYAPCQVGCTSVTFTGRCSLFPPFPPPSLPHSRMYSPLNLSYPLSSSPIPLQKDKDKDKDKDKHDKHDKPEKPQQPPPPPPQTAAPPLSTGGIAATNPPGIAAPLMSTQQSLPQHPPPLPPVGAVLPGVNPPGLMPVNGPPKHPGVSAVYPQHLVSCSSTSIGLLKRPCYDYSNSPAWLVPEVEVLVEK